MSNGNTIKKVTRGWVLGAALLASAACQDLQVDNTTAPDRARATANPNDVQALIGGLFYPTFYNAINTSLAVNLWPYAASEFTASLAGTNTFLWYLDLVEPRIQHNNGAVIPQSNGPHGPRNYWSAIGRASAIAYDGLQLLNSGMVILENNVDVTPRARAFAKFMQGWSWGYQALIFDQVHIVPETTDLPTQPAALQALILSSLTPANQAMNSAIAALEEAITIAKQHPTVVRYPDVATSTLWFGSPTPISNAQFIQMANTLAARLMVLNARTPQERAQVNWQKVLQLTAAGISTPANDFNFQLASNRTSNLLARVQNNTTGGTTNGRWDYRAIGPADQSGAYQAWVNAQPADRDRFNVVTTDRRITGTSPTSDGSYTRYRADNNGFEVDRGTYFRSAYQWSRHAIRNGLTGTTTGNDRGVLPLITADENNLLRAEALLRTGDRAGAAALINITRTRTQRIGTVNHPGLPPVTAAGVPTVDGVCIPRTDAGACGSLLAALRYEMMIELAGTDILIGYANSRGLGILPEGSLLSFPVPGNVLQLYGLEEYTYGGQGQPNTATYSPATIQ